MRKSVLFIYLLVSTLSFTQVDVESIIYPKEGKQYKVESEFKAKLFTNGTCQQGQDYDVCDNQVFEVIYVKGDKIIIKIKGTVTCGENQAKTGKSYCMIRDLFTSANLSIIPEKIKKVKPGFAFVSFAVPMKFDFDSYKVYPGGELGLAPGFRLRFLDKKNNNENSKVFSYSSSLTFTPFFGFTTIPLNDINSAEAPDIGTVGAFSLGGGVGFAFNGGTQLGLYYGTDFYNTGGVKYRKQWISLGVGYEFIRLTDGKK